MSAIDMPTTVTAPQTDAKLAVIAGIPHENRLHLSAAIQQPANLRAVLLQYAYYVWRMQEIWGGMLEFHFFSEHYDEANLSYTRLSNLLRNADAECFPVLEDVVMSVESACCYLFKYHISQRAAVIELLAQAEELLFQRSQVQPLLAQHAAEMPELAKFFQRYWDVSQPFFHHGKLLWADQAGAEAAQTQRHLHNLVELADIFAFEMTQLPAQQAA